ncbi:unnamed protein product [Vicia faba]|uniref:Uncharacterized protein n=1 Tax=Vicia faba TaxID=3906 RepID=A0AAV1BE28_VICFA|nr:unnamed protein product [Vicia faba]
MAIAYLILLEADLLRIQDLLNNGFSCVETCYAKNRANIRGRPDTSNYGTESDDYPLEEIEETPASQTMERALQTDFCKAKAADGSCAPVEGCSKGSAGERIKHFPATSFWILIDQCQTRPTVGHVSVTL